MKRIISLMLSFVMILALMSVPAFASDVSTSGYDNLNNEPGDLVIGFLGGSITVADGDSNSQGFNRYATRVTEWFQTKYPAKTVKQVNAGIGGTGSDLGKYRVMTDIGAYAPDVVFVEYAVNDTHYSRLYNETVRSNMETIVRTLQSLPKVPVIVFLYSMHDDSYAKLNYTSIPDHQAVADYYGIETIDFYNYMKPLVEKGEFIWDKTVSGSLTNDNIHPNALGHEQYGNYIISQLESRNILHKNNYGLAPKFESTTVNTRDIKLTNATKSGTWEDSYSGQSDNKYEAIQSTATGDNISFTYTSEGNDTIGVTVLRGEGSYVIDEGTENELSGTFSVEDNNLPVVKTFASGLSAGEHTVKIVNTADGTEVPHLKLGRLVAHGGREVADATTASNGDHVPGSKPANLMQGSQTGNIIGTGNNGKVGYTAYKQDYTGKDSIYKFSATDTVTKGSWGGEGVNFRRLDENTAATSSGILYDGYTAKQDTYVFKTRVRTLAGTPRVGSATTISWVPTYDNIYKGDGFIPGEEWVDYKTTLTSAGDGFTLCFGFSNAVAGDAFLVDFGDGVYYAPEVAYDISLKPTGATDEIIAGGKNTYKAELLNQIEIPATSIAQTFTWSVADANGNAVDGLDVNAGTNGNEAIVTASADVPFGTYYLKAVSTATNWQKTLPVEVVEGPADPYAKDYVPGEMPENLIADPTNTNFWANPTYVVSSAKQYSTAGYAYVTNDVVPESYNGYQIAAGVRILGSLFKANTYTEGEHYVIKFAARSRTENTGFGLRVGIWNGTYGNRKTDVSQLQGYENGIVQIPADGSWEIIQGTFPALTATDVADGRFPTMVVGMAAGTPANVSVEFNSNYAAIPEGVPYFAKEVPHSVTLAGVDGNVVATGNDTIFKSQLLNQLGLTGYLDQTDVTFTVGDAKGIEVDGLTVTGSGATATVSATDEVAEGKYYLRAHYAIDEDTTWTKTLEIEVKGAIANTSDFVQPEKPENLTYHNQVGGSNGATWTSSNVPEDMKVGSQGTPTKLVMSSDRLTTVDSNWFATGIFIVDKAKAQSAPAGTAESQKRFLPEANTDYVFEVKARSVKGNVKIGVANNDTWGSYVIGAHGRDGVQIGTDWTNFKTTLSTVDNSAYRFNYLSFGMVTGEAADYIVVDPLSFYLAEEVAYEFNVTANASTVAQGDVIELDATLLNQIGTEGTLSQEFTWVAVNDERTEYLDGFTFEIDADDASKVKVFVDESVAPGDYLIVAQNAEEGVSKHYTLTVTKADFDVTELTLNVASDSATLAALTVSTSKAVDKVKVVIAAFRGLKLADSKDTLLTLTDGTATLEEDLGLTGLEEGDKVRVFVWDEDLTPFTMKSVWKLPVTIE